MTVVPGGVCVRALPSRLTSTCWRREPSPCTMAAGWSGPGSSRRQWWPWPAAWASLTASTTSGERSVLSYESGRPASRRASSSRSSTRPVIRAASDSMRPSACRVSGPISSRPRRVSSAYPRMEASGVRSSWLASATNCRTRVSLSCRALSAEPTCPSIRLSAAPTCPTSVRESASAAGTRSRRATSPLCRGSSDTRVAVVRRPACSGRSATPTSVAARDRGGDQPGGGDADFHDHQGVEVVPHLGGGTPTRKSPFPPEM